MTDAPSATRDELRTATLLLVEAASSLAMAIGEIRSAVLVLQHIVAGDAPNDDPHALVRESLNDALGGLVASFDSLDAAGRTLGATDD